MVKCAIKKCGVSIYHIRKHKLPIQLHVFPKGSARRGKWLRFCSLKDQSVPLYLCSRHFQQEDFENVYCSDTRRVLSREAVPSIRLPEPEELSERSLRAQRKARASVVAQMLEKHDQEEKTLSSTAFQDSIQDIIQRNPMFFDETGITCIQNDRTDNSLHTEAIDFTLNSTVVHDGGVSGVFDPNMNMTVLCDAISAMEHAKANTEYPCPAGSQRSDDPKFFDDTGITCIQNDRTNNSLHTEAIDFTLNSTVVHDGGVSGVFDPNMNRTVLCDTISAMDHAKANTEYPCPAGSQRSDDSVFGQIFATMESGSQATGRSEVLKRGSISRLQAIIKNQRQTIRNLRDEVRIKDSTIKSNDLQLKKLTKQINELTVNNDTLRKACAEMGSVSDTVIENRIRGAFLKVFSANRTDLMLGTKKRVVWTPEEIAEAFSLRYHSQPAYEIVRRDMNIPMPCLRTLREWASSIDMRQGLLNDVLSVLEVSGRHLPKHKRVVVLAYDEMSVSETIERDKRNDILGPHKEMQVICARGFFAKWKQPIYVNFDQKITVSILNEVITRLHDIGFTVVGNVHDCGGGNLGVWKEVGIDVEKEQTYMKHPVTNDEIYFLPPSKTDQKLAA